MEHSQEGTYHDCPMKDPKSIWKCQIQIFVCSQWIEAADTCGWIRERLEETEEGNPVGGPAVSIILDPWDLSSLDYQPGSIHQLIWACQHIYSRGLLGLGSVREDEPNPQGIGEPREFRGLDRWVVGGGWWIHPDGDRRLGRSYWMWKSQRVGWEEGKQNLECKWMNK